MFLSFFFFQYEQCIRTGFTNEPFVVVAYRGSCVLAVLLRCKTDVRLGTLLRWACYLCGFFQRLLKTKGNCCSLGKPRKFSTK